MGSARAEDPLGKVVFFTKLAEAVPTESAVFCRSGNQYTLYGRMDSADFHESYCAAYGFCAIIKYFFLEENDSFFILMN